MADNTLDGTWRHVDEGLGGLIDFIVPYEDTLIPTVQQLTELVQLVGEVKRTSMEVLQFLAGVQASGFAVLAQILEQIRLVIEDFRNTGIYMLPIGFATKGDTVDFVEGTSVTDSLINNFTKNAQAGGLAGTARFLRANLLNTRDPQRPNFSSTSFVTGFGLIAYAPDATALTTVIRVFEQSFFSDEMLKRLVKLEKFVSNIDPQRAFEDAFAMHRVQATAQPLPDSPWITTNLGQLLPGLADGLLLLESSLVGLQGMLPVNPLNKFIAFIDATLQQLEDFLTAITELVEWFQLFREAFPLLIFSFPPQHGGTEAVARSLTTWFDPTKNPGLDRVPDNAYMVGLFGMMGSTGISDVENFYDTLQTIIQFTEAQNT